MKNPKYDHTCIPTFTFQNTEEGTKGTDIEHRTIFHAHIP